MKTARALTLKSFALAAALLAAPSLAHAVPFVYNYTGANYDVAVPPYAATDNLTGSFTVDLPTNLGISPLTDIAADLVSFTFSDGVQTIDSNGAFLIFSFEIATDAFGAITEWNIFLTDGAIAAIASANNAGGQGDFVSDGTSFAFNTTVGTFGEVPEPASFALFAIALGGLGFAARRRRA